MEGNKTYNWKPVKGHIMTKWADEIDPQNTLSKYPRPQMVRDEWKCLNGIWDYTIESKEAKKATSFNNKILVPFCIESALSGVKKPLMPDERLWYKRNFEVPKKWFGKRILLHFGAVDWETNVYINGIEVGKHTGGYIPFSFDVTDSLIDGTNEIQVAVWDPSDAHWQQKGKQKLNPKNIYYTPSSGIWQTVWLEPVANSYIKSFRVTPDIDSNTVTLKYLINTEKQLNIKAVISSDNKIIETLTKAYDEDMIIPIDNAILWCPDNPHLYDLTIELLEGEKVVDSIGSYFGMRKYSIMRDNKGIKRLALNNKIVFHNGPLDQGYWPDGIYTAPTDEALKFDIEATKSLGFNMIRKHIKVEPARWYYWCDKLGIIVWQDMINGGTCAASTLDMVQLMVIGKNMRKDTTIKAYKKAMRSKKASRDDFEREYKEMIDHLYNFTCIGMWVPFNESWGQFDADRISKWTKEYDPSRTVDHASGWWDQGTDDLQSHHMYFKALKMPKISGDRALVLSEYGGYALRVDNHIWSEKTFGYKKMKDSKELQNAYISLITDQLFPFIEKGFCAAVYTQTTDVENEINGFYTYDRKVLKVDEDVIYRVNKELL